MNRYTEYGRQSREVEGLQPPPPPPDFEREKILIEKSALF